MNYEDWLDVCNSNRKKTTTDYTREQLIAIYEQRMFQKCQQMLEFEDLPQEIPQRDLIFYLQSRGLTGIVKVNDKLYAVRDTNGSADLDAYYHAQRYVTTNPYIKGLKSNYTRGVDIAIIWHDSMSYLFPMKKGLYHTIHEACVMLADIHITMSMNTILERSPYILSVSDEPTRIKVKAVIDALKKGELQVAVDKASSLKDKNTITPLQFGVVPVGSLKELIELENYTYSALIMELGLNSNYNMKREYVNSNENQIDGLTLLPQIDDIISTIQQGLDEMNKLFGTTTKVKLGKAWTKLQEEVLEDNEEKDEEIGKEDGNGEGKEQDDKSAKSDLKEDKGE